MIRILAVAILMAGMATFALAGSSPTPEIDAATGPAAIALVCGGLLVLRSRKSRKP